LGGGLRR
jgi:hypothetical protein